MVERGRRLITRLSVIRCKVVEQLIKSIACVSIVLPSCQFSHRGVYRRSAVVKPEKSEHPGMDWMLSPTDG